MLSRTEEANIFVELGQAMRDFDDGSNFPRRFPSVAVTEKTSKLPGLREVVKIVGVTTSCDSADFGGPASLLETPDGNCFEIYRRPYRGWQLRRNEAVTDLNPKVAQEIAELIRANSDNPRSYPFWSN